MNKKNDGFCSMNEHAIGIVMKEMVRRSIVTIRNQRQAFEVKAKEGHDGKMNDVLTSADNAAQEVYLRSIHECFPGWGIIAEEDSLVEPCTDGSGYYFTIDPLDGTKAFVRRQSHGVGTMISLSKNEHFVSAYVGDINTQEIYGFRPNSRSVHRITEYSISEKLKYKSGPLPQGYVILRDPEKVYSDLSQQFSKMSDGQIVDGGSIGIWMARLWKGEVRTALLPPSMETPWDSNPVNAISLMLGYTMFKPSVDGKRWEDFKPLPITKKIRRDHDILIVHRSNHDELFSHQ